MKHPMRVPAPAKAAGLVSRLGTHERGATATEYSVLAGFIALVILAGVGLFGAALNSFIGLLGSGLKAALGIP